MSAAWPGVADATGIEATFRADKSLDAVAYVDLDAGVLLGLYAREDDARGAAETAASTAAELCCQAPDSQLEGPVSWALVASECAVHVYARSLSCPERAVVAVARPDANVALVLAALRSMVDGSPGGG